MGRGIDWGIGKSNADPKTGIRYGVISGRDVPAWGENAESVYDDPDCPKCGHQLASTMNEAIVASKDWYCPDCDESFWNDSVCPDDPSRWQYKDSDYEAVNCLDSDVMVLKSPYFTRARFCSPCVPGAGDLNNPDPEGVEAYCFGHNWFEDDQAPYPVYSVATRREVVRVERFEECPNCKGTGRDSLQRIAEMRGESIEQVRADAANEVFFMRRLGQLGREEGSDEFECYRCAGVGQVASVTFEEKEE